MTDAPPPESDKNALTQVVLGLMDEHEKLYEKNRELQEEVVELRESLAEFKRKSELDSSNSSAPPSSDKKKRNKEKKKKQEDKKKKWRKPGGKSKHVGAGRKKLPPEMITKFVDCSLDDTTCSCGGEITSLTYATSHQVIGIDSVTECRMQRGRCRSCRKMRTAGLPDGVTFCIFDERLTALNTFLAVESGVTIRKRRQLLDEFF